MYQLILSITEIRRNVLTFSSRDVLIGFYPFNRELLNHPETLEALAMNHHITSKGLIKNLETFCDFILEVDLRNDHEKIFLPNFRKIAWAMEDHLVDLLPKFTYEGNADLFIVPAILSGSKEVCKVVADRLDCRDMMKKGIDAFSGDYLSQDFKTAHLRLAMMGKRFENIKMMESLL